VAGPSPVGGGAGAAAVEARAPPKGLVGRPGGPGLDLPSGDAELAAVVAPVLLEMAVLAVAASSFVGA
jgi:hypothetical protein